MRFLGRRHSPPSVPKPSEEERECSLGVSREGKNGPQAMFILNIIMLTVFCEADKFCGTCHQGMARVFNL
jgi:hypothetical protein